MSLPGGIRTTLAVALLLIVGGALGGAYLMVVPSLERRLVAEHLDELQRDAEATAYSYTRADSRAAILAVSILAFVILGSVLEGIPAIVLFGPLVFPIAHQMGVHEVHYAMVVILAMGIGLFAPVRRRFLRGLRHRPGQSGRGHEADPRLHGGACRRADRRRGRAVDFRPVSWGDGLLLEKLRLVPPACCRRSPRGDKPTCKMASHNEP